MCVCVCTHSGMNITSIDPANVGRKDCRPQQLINIPLITWDTECVLLKEWMLVVPPPPKKKSRDCIYINAVPLGTGSQTHTHSTTFLLFFYFLLISMPVLRRTCWWDAGTPPAHRENEWVSLFLFVSLLLRVFLYVDHSSSLAFAPTVFPEANRDADLKCQHDLWLPRPLGLWSVFFFLEKVVQVSIS